MMNDLRAMPKQDEMAVCSPLMSRIAGVSHAYFTRQCGVSTGIYTSLNGGQGSSDDAAAVAENRARMAARLGVTPANLLSLYQIHSPEVVTVTEAWDRTARPKADGMVTRVPGLALGVGSADCGPILFADEGAGIIGACHSGWKGAVGGVIEATVAAMEALGSHRGGIVACLGMTISQENYEVGPEFVDRLKAMNAANESYFIPSPKPGHALFDLPGYIMMRLGLLGLKAAEDLALCTYADEARFFSYRRTTHRSEPDYGRHISAIALNR